MKTKKWILTILAIVFISNIYATEPFKLRITPLERKRAVVDFWQEVPKRHEISIYDKNQESIYSWKSKKEFNRYVRIINFCHVDDGNYTIKFKSGESTIYRDICIDNGEISVKPEISKIDPVFVFKNDELKFTYLNFLQEDIRFKLYSNGELIYKTDLGKNFSITQGFDLSKLKTGKYDLMLAGSENEYWHTIDK